MPPLNTISRVLLMMFFDNKVANVRNQVEGIPENCSLWFSRVFWIVLSRLHIVTFWCILHLFHDISGSNSTALLHKRDKSGFYRPQQQGLTFRPEGLMQTNPMTLSPFPVIF